ncbi:lamin-C-like [Musca autumnalis]|uniref:lamin-C-like n=1 Tax=Musca autumnalis TaxID=221902 RepID=UPI003CEF3BD8
MVRFGKISRVAPKEVKVKDYEEINGKWFPKINTRQVDSNSIRKVENVTIPELKKIEKFTGSVGETTERKNENVRADVSLKFESEVNQLREKNEQLKARLEQTTKDWQIAEKKARMYESRAADLNAKYDASTAYTKEAGVELCEVHAELELLRKQIKEDAQARIELEGNIQHLRNELTFKEKFHSEEINELRTGLSKQYETILQQSLQELREQHERKMRKMKMLYEQKIKDLQAETNRESVAASRAIEELDVSHQNIESLYIGISKLESTNAALNGRNCDLEKLLANERRRHASEIAKVDAELQQLQESVVYEKLLYDEEVSSHTEWAVTSREKDHIEISQSDLEEMVLKKGTKEVHIGGFQFKPNANDKENYVNFHRSGTIEGDINKLRVSATYEPPINMVMKSQEIQSGASKKASMFNANEEVTGYRTTRADASNVSGYPLRRKWIYHEILHR